MLVEPKFTQNFLQNEQLTQQLRGTGQHELPATRLLCLSSAIFILPVALKLNVMLIALIDFT